MLSSNSSSSRAIPFFACGAEYPYLPFDVRKQEKGMQGYENIDDGDLSIFQNTVENLYYEVCHEIVLWSKGVAAIHKQHLNRYIEPWMLQKKVVTATEWDNFFNLRLHPDAQPEIQELARCMKGAMDLVVPTKLRPGEWHLPYVTSDEYNGSEEPSTEDAIKYSVARCARVSYLNHDKSNPDIVKDLALADMLAESGHYSPFEHQATPMLRKKCDKYYDSWVDVSTIIVPWERGITHVDYDGNYWSANFRGWIQNRQLI